MARVAPSPRETSDMPEEGAVGVAAGNVRASSEETLVHEAARQLRRVQTAVTEWGGAWGEELRRLNSLSRLPAGSLVPPAGFINKIRAGRAAFYPELPWVRHSIADP